MLNSVVTFASDAAGLEKLLRLGQGFCAIGVGLATELRPWRQAQAQFALARRYFRLLKWHTCWKMAVAQYSLQQPPTRAAIAATKWSMLAIYFFLEAFTIVRRPCMYGPDIF